VHKTVVKVLCAVGLISPVTAMGQSVVARHSVSASVGPVIAIRDSVSSVSPDSAGYRWTWIGTVTSNVPASLAVRGVEGARPTGQARVDGGRWIAIAGGEWSSVIDLPAGRRQVRIDMRMPAPSGATPARPGIRAISR
jgi:hypothetical protein